MGSIVGFNFFIGLEPDVKKKALASQEKALSFFTHLERKSLSHHAVNLELWGHAEFSERIHTMRDGSLLILVGSPYQPVNWHEVEDKLLKVDRPADFELPWEGRVILFRISADGEKWTMWNDWIGSIPVFHTAIGRGRIVSTLEPVVVATAGYSSDDFFLPGLVSLLINGHYLSDWTLYKGMKVVRPDSVSEWDEKGFRVNQLWTVKPSQSRWEAGWDDLVDEMHALSHKAVSDILKTQSTWILPLSSGLDSRLIAGVAADIGANAYTYAWGGHNTTDVVFSRRIAKTLGFPWKHIDLPKDFLSEYTTHWGDWFGSAMHFHGMYQMSFLDRIRSEPSAPVVSGFIGDVLAGDAIGDVCEVHSSERSYQLESDWYCHWTANEVRSHAKFPWQEAMEINADEFKKQIDSLPGAFFQKMQLLELWNRQRHFTSFQSILSDYWRGVANPFMNRDYARFCLSIPRVALDERRLLSGVFRRYYGRLAVIPGTYAQDPFILTGKYLVLRKIAGVLAPAFHRGPLKGMGNVQLRMDIASVQATGRDALYPLFDVLDRLSNWVDVEQLERDYQTIVHSQKDIRPLRRLQSVQALAYRLLE